MKKRNRSGVDLETFDVEATFEHEGEYFYAHRSGFKQIVSASLFCENWNL